MKPRIQFLQDKEELVIPRRIRLTKSENGETGTATFIFVEPTVFSFFSTFTDSLTIQKMDLLWDNKRISTNDIQIFFKEGKPFIIRSILIFRNSKEWFNFLNFMNCYSKETGLSFTEGVY
jgi:photosystem II reaction center protein Psb28